MNRFAIALASLMLTGVAVPSTAQYKPAEGVTMPLWANGAPGSEKRRGEPEQAADYWVKNVHNPSITMFRPSPERANGASVIVFPGGGHRLLVWTNEGVKSAAVLNRMGITVFVVKYRLAREDRSTYSIEGDAAGDARRAVRWVRAHAGEYGLDPARVGVMGFSAGGELVTLIADNRDPVSPPGGDATDRLSARPDFQILVFPGPLGLPANAAAAAPPAFLVAGSRDECCAKPTVDLYEQLREAGVSAELHMYAEGVHAFNLDESDRLSIVRWPDRLHDWLSDGGWLRPKVATAR